MGKQRTIGRQHIARASQQRQRGQDNLLAIGKRAMSEGDWPGLEKVCRQRLASSPSDSFGQQMLGLALAKQGRYVEACASYEDGLKHLPNSSVLWTNFSITLGQMLRLHDAYKAAAKAVELAPRDASCLLNLMSPCYALARHDEAIQLGQRALLLGLPPEMRALVLNNIGNNLRDQGHGAQAVALYRQSIELHPAVVQPYTNLMLTLQSMADASDQDLIDAANLFADRFESGHRLHWPRFAERCADPHRKLKVGFLSPDFNMHAVVYFVEGVLGQMNRNEFEVEAYYLQAGVDSATSRLIRKVDHFASIAGLTVEQQLELLRQRKLDILIDLAGHTAKNGLEIMARKAAPLQVTWLGFPGTTGLRSIDWRITDIVADPPGAEALYTEKLARLPEPFCVYRPMAVEPLRRYAMRYQVQPTPALQNGYITFGSCNAIAKITDDVLRVWSGILARVPESKLLIEGKGFGETVVKEAFRLRCLSAGIADDRLQLINRDSGNQYLTYHHIDIALDPFPLVGGTTSFDAVWMGVPLVSLAGKTFRSRMGVSILTGIGRTDWLANDEDAYIDVAVRLASDVDFLNATRLQLRTLVEASPLMGERRFTRLFEEALRQMWWRWCASRERQSKHEVEVQLQQWQTNRPLRSEAQTRVALEAGKWVDLPGARQILQERVQQASQAAAIASLTSTKELSPHWAGVIDLSKLILESVPCEPLALAALGEAERAHGNLIMAIQYMNQALKSAPGQSYMSARAQTWALELQSVQSSQG